MRLTDIIDVSAGSGEGCAGAGAEGQVSVSGRLHLYITALRVLAGQAGRISDGGVRVLTIEGTRAGATHRGLYVICTHNRTDITQIFIFHRNAINIHHPAGKTKSVIN